MKIIDKYAAYHYSIRGLVYGYNGSPISSKWVTLEGWTWNSDFAKEVKKFNIKPSSDFLNWVLNFNIKKYIEEKNLFRFTLNNKTVIKLKLLAKSMKIHNYHKLKKQELIKKIMNNKYTDTL